MRIEKVGFVSYVTYTIISPERELSAKFQLNLICSHIVAFKRASICPNRLSYLRENCADRLSVKGLHTYTYIDIFRSRRAESSGI